MSRIPLRINGICRRVHEVLTGTKAAKCAEGHGLIEANGMREVWRDLDRCWRDLEVLKETILQDGDHTRRVYIEQYACAWQVRWLTIWSFMTDLFLRSSFSNATI
jgi:hypothetical protein